MHCHFTFADIDEEKGNVMFFIKLRGPGNETIYQSFYSFLYLNLKITREKSC